MIEVSAALLTKIREALKKGYCVELYLKPSGVLSVKTVFKKEIK